MWTIRGRSARLCDGSTRREFLRVGAVSGLIGLPGLLRAEAEARGGTTFGKAKRCILLFPFGGPSQIDTFDPKPDAPEGVRGEFKPIETSVPGVRIGEMFPRLAGMADKYAIVRSVTHADAVHTTAGYTMLTGRPHARANDPAGGIAVRPTPDDHPHVGSIVASARDGAGGLPPFVSMPEVVRDAGLYEVPGQGPGFLGGRNGPMLFEADAKRRRFSAPDFFAPADLGEGRLADRRSLREQLDRRVGQVEAGGRLAALDAHYQRAFDLEAEPVRERDAYGHHLFGQGCLLARRLIEAGVALVTVYWHYEGPEDSPAWDTHENNFKHFRERLAPPSDRAFARLLEDLSGRGLLEETLVVWMGEFGRSPRVNPKAGREHWPHVQSVVLAGAGIAGGSVFGSSDRIGGYPASDPVTPADLVATILHSLGIRPELELRDRIGRPFPASEGTPLHALFG